MSHLSQEIYITHHASKLRHNAQLLRKLNPPMFNPQDPITKIGHEESAKTPCYARWPEEDSLS